MRLSTSNLAPPSKRCTAQPNRLPKYKPQLAASLSMAAVLLQQGSSTSSAGWGRQGCCLAGGSRSAG
jgi:hypothetical protein